MKTLLTPFITVVLAGASVTGCMTSDAEDFRSDVAEAELTEVPMTRLGALELDDRVVEFYEEQPGVILGSELGPAGTPPMVTQEMYLEMTPTELFFSLAPDAELTGPLAGAFERAAVLQEQRVLRPPSQPVRPESPRLGTKTGALSTYDSVDMWFYNKFNSR